MTTYQVNVRTHDQRFNELADKTYEVETPGMDNGVLRANVFRLMEQQARKEGLMNGGVGMVLTIQGVRP